jgi:hypothetical protein
VGVGADEGLPDEVRFVANVTRLIRVRLAEDPGGETIPSVFFLLPRGPQNVALKREPLLHNGLVALGKRFWFVSPMVTNAHGLKLDEWDDDQAFIHAEEALGIGDTVAVLFDPRPATPQLYLYPKGLGDRDRVMRLLLDASQTSLRDVLEVVDTVHKNFLVTPAVQDAGKLWKASTQHLPVGRPEAVIQGYLRVGLQAAFPSCVVRREQHGVAGRLDLEVEEPIPGQVGGLVPKAILELKVLKTYTSAGTKVAPAQNSERVRDGVKQVAAYKKERNALEAALCCFDMRVDYTGDTCFDDVNNLAKRHKVVLRAWHLFNSAKAFQRATIPD